MANWNNLLKKIVFFIILNSKIQQQSWQNLSLSNQTSWKNNF